jgi:hypothetical protein
MTQRRRWVVVVALLGLGWLASPGTVPLYDGVGFPDEPYRFVPARGTGPAATSADVQLKVANGVNSGGLLANSAELGPQVSVYAPPQAFATAGAGPVRLRAEPVPPAPPLPPGELESNVYALTLTVPAGDVRVRPEAQPPGITLRAVSVAEPLPVVQYRATPGDPWKALKTRRVGRDNFNATAPGQGEYVLTRVAAATPTSSGNGGLLLVVGLAVVVMVGVLVGVRMAGRRQEPG